MNEINKKLIQAQERQGRFYTLAALGFGIIALVVCLAILVSRGTRIEVLPQDAAEMAEITTTKGLAVVVGATLYSLSSEPHLGIQSPGFKDGNFEVGKASLGETFVAELFPLPAKIYASTTLEDPVHAEKTKWILGDKRVGSGGVVEFEVEAGAYVLKADNPFYEIEESAFEVGRGEEEKLQIVLGQPVMGRLHIDSEPQGATVFIDDASVGVTPLIAKRKGGLYQVRVVLEKYAETTETISVTRKNSTLKRKYKLQPEQGLIFPQLSPLGGTLLIDGVEVKGSSIALDAHVEHDLVYMKAGYAPQKKKIQLGANEKATVRFQLADQRGTISITSTPPATVWIGSQQYGTTPLSLQLPALAHKITLKKKGYTTASKRVRIEANRTQKVHLQLTSARQTQKQSASQNYSNTLGMKLKLFSPNVTYTMGASRSEKGQRANEFLRTTTLNQPFYAGLYEVTAGQFKKYRSQTSGTTNIPVTGVSWQDAAKFCNWLSTKEKLAPFYKEVGGTISGYTNTNGYRLLSEAEWEWLARKAGKNTTTTFVWGNSSVVPARAANIADESAKGQVRYYIPRYTDGYGGIAPVGNFTKESSGLYDLGGNVSEWVHDIYSVTPPKTGAQFTNPLGSMSGYSHVIKGANFRSGNARTLRPAFREGLTSGRDDLGFRVGRYLYGGGNG